MKHILYILSILIITLSACEKEIEVDLPPSTPQLVVEASVNTYSPWLNYVFISNTIDYFKPDLSFNGVKGATVYITPGKIINNDTLFDKANRYTFADLSNLSNIPGLDSIGKSISGMYLNPLFRATANTSYLLEISLADGRVIAARTHIPPIVPIDSMIVRYDGIGEAGKKNAYLSFWFNDGPEQNNYRMALRNNPDSVLFGWGNADSYRTFDDEFVNNGVIPLEFLRPFEGGDTLNIYFTSIGRKEFRFWQSFGRAANNGGPFATPGNVKSNIDGVIGSFTGYAVDFKRIIFDE